jgi:hypothetical protein
MPTQIGENRAKKMLKANELMLCITAVRSISEQIQLVSYLRSNAFVGVVGKRLIQW